MKYLIFELFSGVGLCNQLFSLEAGIYLSYILDRKLILVIKNPLCHCGKNSWDFGYLLNFFTNEYYKFLPQGIEVHYKSVPPDIEKHMTDQNEFLTDRFSNIVFVDKDLNTPENQSLIKDFCHYRKPVEFDIDSFQRDYVYINKTNASRCFYNFFTKPENYILMYDICTAIKFKPIYYLIADQIFSQIPKNNNELMVFVHCRFGDLHKPKEFIERANSQIIKNLSEYFEGHRTNMIRLSIFNLIDNKNNPNYLNAMKKYNIKYVDELTNNKFVEYTRNNQMLFHNTIEVKRYEVTNAILDMILATKADEFIGYSSSTFSHYIQFLRFTQHRSCQNYCNLSNKNLQYCRLLKVKESPYEWIKLGFQGGHPVGWHFFFKPSYIEQPKIQFTIDGKTDGFGSQLQACFSLIAYCHYKDYQYVHQPFYRMQHNDENIPDFHSIMNKFVNLEHKFTTTNQLTNLETSQLHKFKEGFFVHGSLKPEFFYTEEVLKILRECYYSSPKHDISQTFLKDKYNVAIHIRRGDVFNGGRHGSRYSTNDEYISLLSKHNWPENVQLHIFSEGKDDDFQDILKIYPYTKLHISKNIQFTFHCLVEADVLIMSKSSFCYSAALLNNKKVIGDFLKSWWHKPLKQWI